MFSIPCMFATLKDEGSKFSNFTSNFFASSNPLFENIFKYELVDQMGAIDKGTRC